MIYYEKLVELYQELESTTKRLEKTFLIAKFLSKCQEEDLESVILLLQGRVFPEWDPREIGIASKLIIRALSRITGIKIATIESEWARQGDLGLVAKNIAKRKKQSTLFSRKLTTINVLTVMRKIALQEGEGTIDKKLAYISDLLLNASPLESLYIVRTLLGELRIGIAGGILRDAITWAFVPLPYPLFQKCSSCKEIVPTSDKCMNCGKELIPIKPELSLSFDELREINQRNRTTFIPKQEDARTIYNKLISLIEDSYNILNDFSELAKLLYSKGLKPLNDLQLIPGRPIRVMLAQKAESLSQGIKALGLPLAVEYKYDGFRMQIHKYNDTIKIYTRRLEEVTHQFPDVVEAVKTINAENFILDSECIAIDPKTKKFLPFQNISQRIKRKYDINQMIKEIPVELHVFDILFYNNETLLKKQFIERRKIIESIIKEGPILRLAVQKIINSEKEGEEFYKESLEKGNEGIMLKALSAPYKPGLRVGYIMKLKPIKDTIDLVITGAEWGEGKRSNWLSSFIVACIDPVTGEYLDIGKVGSGLKEKSSGLTFEELTNLLKPLIISEEGRLVRVRPEIVIEVAYQEIQKSPKYASGYALRFPRIVSIRNERSPREITTINEIENLYKSQQSN